MGELQMVDMAIAGKNIILQTWVLEKLILAIFFSKIKQNLIPSTFLAGLMGNLITVMWSSPH